MFSKEGLINLEKREIGNGVNSETLENLELVQRDRESKVFRESKATNQENSSN